jgi:hypothetical protein
MGKVWLTDEQKRVVRRYATTWQLWRKGDRSFASLEYDMAAGYEVLADGIAVDRKARHGITADAGDPEYYAAIFGNDDAAVPDFTAEELRQLREYNHPPQGRGAGSVIGRSRNRIWSHRHGRRHRV